MTATARKPAKLFIVGENIDREKAHFADRAGTLRRIVKGIYINAEDNFRDVFQTHGLRLAHQFKNAALTHSSAWYRRPVDDRVFIGGDYPYKKIFAADGYEARVVQSMTKPDYEDPRQYEEIEVVDPMGSFTMWCATPELILLHQMDATKRNLEKRLPETEVLKIWQDVIQRHGGRARAMDAIHGLALDVNKRNESDRFFRDYYRSLQRTSE